MEDLKMITDIVKNVLNMPLNIFGYTVSILSVIVGTIILSVAISFVIKVFGGE